MIEKLIDQFIGLIEKFYFTFIVREYDEVVVLRFGKFKGEYQKAGMYFKLPFGIDSVLRDNVVFTTSNLNEQSLTSKDDKKVVASAVVAWSIDDIRKVLLEVEEVDDVIADSTYGIVGRLIADSEWDYIRTEKFLKELKKQVADKAKKLGIKIHDVYFSDLSNSPSVRVWGGGFASSLEEEDN